MLKEKCARLFRRLKRNLRSLLLLWLPAGIIAAFFAFVLLSVGLSKDASFHSCAQLLARCAAALKPPPAMTLSEWADRYRVLSAESSAEPGRWHTDKAPYQREIMDAIGDPHIRKVVIMSAAQIGKTDAFILNPLGYYID